MQQFRQCRSCYHHIGGIYAVEFFSHLLENKFIEYVNRAHFGVSRKRLLINLTRGGQDYFSQFGRTLPLIGSAYACIDGTERKPHLAGPAGNMILEYLFRTDNMKRGDEPRTLCPSKEAIDFLTGQRRY